MKFCMKLHQYTIHKSLKIQLPQIILSVLSVYLFSIRKYCHFKRTPLEPNKMFNGHEILWDDRPISEEHII